LVGLRLNISSRCRIGTLSGCLDELQIFDTSAEWVSVDLRDEVDAAVKIGEVSGITHIAYAAVYEKPDTTRGWGRSSGVLISALLESVWSIPTSI
tara:strand:- start:4 stop:288 length:285 start_codon:yes stop_codon:yes gene_type:complete